MFWWDNITTPSYADCQIQIFFSKFKMLDLLQTLPVAFFRKSSEFFLTIFKKGVAHTSAWALHNPAGHSDFLSFGMSESVRACLLPCANFISFF